MARVRLRTRAKRGAYLLLVLVLLLLLLELNQWLPGTWPGGGGGGFRVGGERGLPDPAHTGAVEAPPAERPERPSALEPPAQAPTDWPPREGVTVEVRTADGMLAEGWSLGIGEGGASDARPLPDGSVTTRDKRVVAEGIRLRSPAGVLRHRHGTATPAARWSIRLPRGDLPVRRAPGALEVQVTHAGLPIAGAEVHWSKGEAEQVGRTDADGRLQIQGTRDGQPLALRVVAPGHLPQAYVLEQHDPRAGHIDLDKLVETTVRYEPSEHSVLSAALRAADGTLLAKGAVSVRGPEGQRATFRGPGRVLREAWIETIVGTPQGPFVFRRPLAGAPAALPIPGARLVSVRLRDAQGGALDTPPLQTEFATYRGSEAEDEPRETALEHRRVQRPGGLGRPAVQEAGFVVADGARTRLLLEPEGAVPIVRTLEASDGSDVLELVREPGLRVPVLVRGPDGAPLPAAQVTVRASHEGVRIARTGSTDAEGRAFLGPLGPWPVEVFARAAGHAAAARVVEVRAGMATVTLDLLAGYPLRLVVEDPYGRALAGVDVEIVPRAGAAPLVATPEDAPHTTDGDGVLHLPGVPDGLYDLTLTREGYGPQTLHGVRPGAVTHFATLIAR